MNQKQLELLNIVTDLRRALMDYALSPDQANYQNSSFLQNIVKNFSHLQKLDPVISQFVDINYLQDDSDPPLVKAEKLLMFAHNLQRHLEY